MALATPGILRIFDRMDSAVWLNCKVLFDWIAWCIQIWYPLYGNLGISGFWKAWKESYLGRWRLYLAGRHIMNNSNQSGKHETSCALYGCLSVDCCWQSSKVSQDQKMSRSVHISCLLGIIVMYKYVKLWLYHIIYTHQSNDYPRWKHRWTLSTLINAFWSIAVVWKCSHL